MGRHHRLEVARYRHSACARTLLARREVIRAILRRVIDLIQGNARGNELGPTLEVIESALRADQAKLIEAE